jgi:hypothetical protein
MTARCGPGYWQPAFLGLDMDAEAGEMFVDGKGTLYCCSQASAARRF